MGSLIGIVGVSSDLTDRMRADEDRAHIAAIVTSSEDAIFARSLDGVITAWNAGAERVYGYSAAEMIGQTAACIVSPERPGEITDLLERIARGERVEHFETVRVRKDGQQVDISASISPIRNASGPGYRRCDDRPQYHRSAAR
jgi:PAS domain S-box-containing protein